MYHSNGIGSQLEARIHVYDGRLWVDRGGGSKGESSMDDSDDSEDGIKDSSSSKEQLSSSSSQQEDDEDVEPRSLTGNDVITDDDDDDDDDDEKEKKKQSSSSFVAAAVDGGGGGNWESRTATISQLLVDKAQMTHSGRYICSAVGSSGTWTHVHILPGNQLIIVYLCSTCSFILSLFAVCCSQSNHCRVADACIVI